MAACQGYRTELTSAENHPFSEDKSTFLFKKWGILRPGEPTALTMVYSLSTCDFS